jgi:two-component system osmolarity sensor histidine kinase EnvZ
MTPFRIKQHQRRHCFRLGTPRLTLFWRTFSLIALVLGISLVAWLQVFRAVELSPKAERLGWEIASVVNLTRAGLLSTVGERRLTLLADLARDEGIRVMPAEPSDQIEGWSDPEFAAAFEKQLRLLLGTRTRLAARVDGAEGLWILFEIDDDPYWMRLEPARLERQTNRNWLGWVGIALALATAAALFISRLVNRPLADLMRAIDQLSRSASLPRLREDGPSELAEVNRRFNRLAAELLALDQDRREALAGISHDIRTPLTRLRLDLEFSGANSAAQSSMIEEIERINAIVHQFMEFARPLSLEVPTWTLVRAAVIEVCARYTEHPAEHMIADIEIDPNLVWFGSKTMLIRIMSNLLENARRYARDPHGKVRVGIAAARTESGIALTVRDYGPGVPTEKLDRLTKPFTRLDPERNRDGGAGLGLAIVERLARRHGGELRLTCAAPSGLCVFIQLLDQEPRRSIQTGPL